jgi:transcriptional regulator with XRE-family HTH domain
MTIAKRVREFRYAKGWGPDELASRAEISRTALYQIECGKTEAPRAGTLKRIARALDVSIETLLGSEQGGALEFTRRSGAYATSSQSSGGDDVGNLRVEGQREGGDVRSGPGTGGLHQKLDDLLSSPLADSIAQIVVESHRLLGANQKFGRA